MGAGRAWRGWRIAAGAAALTAALGLAVPVAASSDPAPAIRPQPRPAAPQPVPVARWDGRQQGEEWSRAALAALLEHGRPLTRTVPRDVAQWCPGYKHAQEPERRAFWVGFLSALAKHESTWRPAAVGGGGRWYGLLQILPATARGYGCRARTGNALTDGAANLSCAIRIMAVTVPRDGVIQARTARWRGVAADWGPMRSDSKRREMATWLRQQDYCQLQASPRPRPRPTMPGDARHVSLPAGEAPRTDAARPDAGLKVARMEAEAPPPTMRAR